MYEAAFANAHVILVCCMAAHIEVLPKINYVPISEF